MIRYIRLGSDPGIAVARHRPGSPDPVLVLHGLGDSAILTFAPMFSASPLATLPALFIDVPGFGHSPAPSGWPGTVAASVEAIAKVLDLLKLSHVRVVGHSMGGSIAILLAATRPDLVRQLIVAEPLLLPENSVLAAAIIRGNEERFVRRGYRMLQAAARQQASRGGVAAAHWIAPLSMADPATIFRMAADLVCQRQPSFDRLFRNFTLPRTLIIGERTALDPSSQPDDVRVVRIPDAGHSMMVENPSAFASAVADALLPTRHENAR